MTDPSISLQVRPPQIEIPSLLDTYGKIMSLRNMGNAQLLQQQQLQEGQQRMQQNQQTLETNRLKGLAERRAVEAQAAQDELVQQNTSFDNGTSELKTNHGAVKAGLMKRGYSDKAAQYATQQKQIETDLLDTAIKNFDFEAKKHDRLASWAAIVDNASDPQQKAALYPSVINGIASENLLAPEQLAQLPKKYTPEMDPQITSFVNQAKTAATQYDEHLKNLKEKRDQAEADVALPGKKADAQKKQLELESQSLGAATTPETWTAALSQLPADRQKLYPAEFSEDARVQAAAQGISPDTRAQLAKASSTEDLALKASKGDKSAKAALEELKKYNISVEAGKQLAVMNALGGGGGAGSGGGGLTIPAAGLGQKNESYLATLPPATANQVRALAEGRMAFPAGRAATSGIGQALIGMVGKYDPSFDTINYNARAKTRQDFTSGATSKNINSLNTVIGHLSDLSDAAEKLNNTKIPAVNSIINWAKTNAGNASVKTFNTTQNAVSDELTRVWRQSGGTEADIQSWKSDLNAANSPEQLHAVIGKIGDLLESKLEALQNQYQQGMGISDIQAITPKAQKTLEKLRGKAGTSTTPEASSTAYKVGDVVTVKGKKIKITALHDDGTFDGSEVK
jgi:hypothetical protein